MLGSRNCMPNHQNYHSTARLVGSGSAQLRLKPDMEVLDGSTDRKRSRPIELPTYFMSERSRMDFILTTCAVSGPVSTRRILNLSRVRRTSGGGRLATTSETSNWPKRTVPLAIHTVKKTLTRHRELYRVHAGFVASRNRPPGIKAEPLRRTARMDMNSRSKTHIAISMAGVPANGAGTSGTAR